MTVRIKENSFYAKYAAKKLKSQKMALVLGKTIHLHNTSKSEFLSNIRWVKHEVAHVLQYKRKGFLRFIVSYLLYTFSLGYEDNIYEVEAREKEKDPYILNGIEFK
jgi:hypothetical protein